MKTKLFFSLCCLLLVQNFAFAAQCSNDAVYDYVVTGGETYTDIYNVTSIQKCLFVEAVKFNKKGKVVSCTVHSYHPLTDLGTKKNYCHDVHELLQGAIDAGGNELPPPRIFNKKSTANRVMDFCAQQHDPSPYLEEDWFVDRIEER